MKHNNSQPDIVLPDKWFSELINFPNIRESIETFSDRSHDCVIKLYRYLGIVAVSEQAYSFYNTNGSSLDETQIDWFHQSQALEGIGLLVLCLGMGLSFSYFFIKDQKAQEKIHEIFWYLSYLSYIRNPVTASSQTLQLAYSANLLSHHSTQNFQYSDIDKMSAHLGYIIGFGISAFYLFMMALKYRIVTKKRLEQEKLEKELFDQILNAKDLNELIKSYENMTNLSLDNNRLRNATVFNGIDALIDTAYSYSVLTSLFTVFLGTNPILFLACIPIFCLVFIEFKYLQSKEKMAELDKQRTSILRRIETIERIIKSTIENSDSSYEIKNSNDQLTIQQSQPNENDETFAKLENYIQDYNQLVTTLKETNEELNKLSSSKWVIRYEMFHNALRTARPVLVIASFIVALAFGVTITGLTGAIATVGIIATSVCLAWGIYTSYKKHKQTQQQKKEQESNDNSQVNNTYLTKTSIFSNKNTNDKYKIDLVKQSRITNRLPSLPPLPTTVDTTPTPTPK